MVRGGVNQAFLAWSGGQEKASNPMYKLSPDACGVAKRKRRASSCTSNGTAAAGGDGRDGVACVGKKLVEREHKGRQAEKRQRNWERGWQFVRNGTVLCWNPAPGQVPVTPVWARICKCKFISAPVFCIGSIIYPHGQSAQYKKCNPVRCHVN